MSCYSKTGQKQTPFGHFSFGMSSLLWMRSNIFLLVYIKMPLATFNATLLCQVFMSPPFFACITQQKCQIISHIIKTEVVPAKNNRNFKNPSRIQRFSFILYQNRIRVASGYCALKVIVHFISFGIGDSTSKCSE